jgi:hypothetical protein
VTPASFADFAVYGLFEALPHFDESGEGGVGAFGCAVVAGEQAAVVVFDEHDHGRFDPGEQQFVAVAADAQVSAVAGVGGAAAGSAEPLVTAPVQDSAGVGEGRGFGGVDRADDAADVLRVSGWLLVVGQVGGEHAVVAVQAEEHEFHVAGDGAADEETVAPERDDPGARPGAQRVEPVSERRSGARSRVSPL